MVNISVTESKAKAASPLSNALKVNVKSVKSVPLTFPNCIPSYEITPLVSSTVTLVECVGTVPKTSVSITDM